MVYRILFVCTGNICRSVTAEAVFRKKLDEAGLTGKIVCDSCGTHDYHVGENPDPRTINVAFRNGIEMADLIARKLHPNDFIRFNLILAMDEGHVRQLEQVYPSNGTAKVDLFLEYAGLGRQNVPDPYYAGHDSFLKVFDLVKEGADKLVEKLRADLK